MRRIVYSIVVILAGPLITSCLQSVNLEEPVTVNDGISINAVASGVMEQYNVTTKGTDIKTSEEQEIKTLHVFIFDSEGNYLQPRDRHRYQGYRSITGGKTVMNIDREGWEEPSKAEHATVIVVANVEPGTFKFTSADTPPEDIPDSSALMNFKYEPKIQRRITSLPESGMPMFGIAENVNLTKSNTANSIDIALRALMSRIDVTIQINSDHTDLSGTLPSLTIEKCEVLNAPQSTLFRENKFKETDLGSLGEMGSDNASWQPSVQTIRNQSGQLSFSFYTFENLQNPGYDGYPNEYKYPADVTDDMKQRYKPELADKDNSLAFMFIGTYITYNGGVYNASYTLYLGANHTNDFKVMRNKQYKNNITIKGITKVGTNTEHVTFDARVDIKKSNPYFISMLKERTMDSHFNVVPMDVYFFDVDPSSTEKVEQKMTVEIMKDENGNIPGWLRLEKIPSTNMAEGTAPQVTSGPELMATGSEWHAGNGKRKYFTTDLVTTTLLDNTSCEITASRDRVYLYVDENLEVWHLGTTEDKTRTATLKLTYMEKKQGEEDWTVIDDTRTITIEQAKLLEVTFDPDDSGDKEAGMGNRRIYIEAYEEYLDYSDPLDEFATNMVYNGLPWEDYTGNSGTEIGMLTDLEGGDGLLNRKNCSSNFYWGYEFTQEIANKVEAERSGSGVLWDPYVYSYAHLNLNTKPKTAAGYCYLKNKRDEFGNVPGHKWYLPGIRELERILEDYYIDYKEFQNNFYWSSAAGEGGGLYSENKTYARATKAYIANVNGEDRFKYYESGTGNEYNGENGTGGFARRKTILRIRCARVDYQSQQQ